MGTYKFKIVVLGERQKSEILKNYLDSCFNKDYSDVIGCNIYIRTEQIDYDEITFSIWDISPSDRFRYFRTSFYHGACSILIFFNLNNLNEIRNIPNWINETLNVIGEKPIFLIGYKTDDEDINQVNINEINEFCTNFNCNYYEIERYNGTLDDLFYEISNITLNNFGYTKEKRAKYYEELKRRNQEFENILRELGYNIINNRVEILTSKGLFTINILNGKVYYEHFICDKCDIITTCNEKVKNYCVKKYLCIVRKDINGWSNVLNNDQLLILSKITSIVEDKLPKHVINQMKSSINCEHGKKVFSKILDPPNALKKKYSNIISKKDINKLVRESPKIIRIKLRNLEMKFWNGLIPPALYFKLKDKYLEALNS
ncbi:MAG: Rab family GTPase [Candidatus Helarchaeota archaeon]